MLAPYETSTKIETPPGEMIITIPARKNILLSIFLSAWMVGWAFGWFSALGTLLGGSSGNAGIFLLAWLTLWTVGGIVAGGMVFWFLAGKEVIHISTSALTIERKIPIWTRRVQCGLTDIKELRATEKMESSAFGRKRSVHGFMSSMGEGTIKFDYGLQTLGFGIEIDTAEAKHIVGAIATKFPNLVKTNS